MQPIKNKSTGLAVSQKRVSLLTVAQFAAPPPVSLRTDGPDGARAAGCRSCAPTLPSRASGSASGCAACRSWHAHHLVIASECHQYGGASTSSHSPAADNATGPCPELHTTPPPVTTAATQPKPSENEAAMFGRYLPACLSSGAADVYPVAKGPPVRISWIVMPWIQPLSVPGFLGRDSRVGSRCFPLLCQTGQRCHIQLILTTKQHLALRKTHSAAPHLPARRFFGRPRPLSASTSGLPPS